MALKIKQGWVHSKKDISQTGRFNVVFDDSDALGGTPRVVHYVSPYGSKSGGFIAIPDPGSAVLVAYDDEAKDLEGMYYLGSIMGVLPDSYLGKNSSNKEELDYVPASKPGISGPGASNTPDSLKGSTSWPSEFRDMYKGSDIIPEAMGLTNWRGDCFKISHRASPNNSPNPFQDYRIGMKSGSGKRFELVDSPQVNGIVMTNENAGKNFFIWSSSSNPNSPFSAGEYHMRTHGPVNLYTTESRFRIGVEDGNNIELENNSTPSRSYGPGVNTGPLGGGLSIDENRGYTLGRKGDFGNETTGNVNVTSKWNNVSVSALGDDSVIHIHAPGENSKVIIETGGTVDIVADKKITLQSKTEIELNAPIIDMNAFDGDTSSPGLVNIDGSLVRFSLFSDPVSPPGQLLLNYVPPNFPGPALQVLNPGVPPNPPGSPPELNSYPPEL